jgi:2-hydroxy-3-keto-5-methylthiopentenyl-1-phosphate phosphatase
MPNPILMVEHNIHGGWAIYGCLGVKQYYGYTKSQAIKMYKEEAEKKIFCNEQKGVTQ